MTDIQRARDVLAKWRTATTKPLSNAYPWTIQHEQAGRANWSDVIVDRDGDWLFDYTDPDDELELAHKGSADPDVVRLIVGTAGNPDLLDALDALLVASAEFVGRFPEGAATFSGPAWDLAAAIIAADERMQQ